MTSSFIEQFQERFESLKGQVHVVSTWEEAAKAAHAVCVASEAPCVALGELPDAMAAAFRQWAQEDGMKVLAPPYESAELPNTIDEAKVGVSSAQFAIAETGTLVEIALDDSYRLVSALPNVHIGVVSAKNFVDRLFDAGEILRDTFQEHDENCVVSFISGPSRTGDIEMILTLGVHGPGEAHAIIVTDEAGGLDG